MKEKETFKKENPKLKEETKEYEKAILEVFEDLDFLPRGMGFGTALYRTRISQKYTDEKFLEGLRERAKGGN